MVADPDDGGVAAAHRLVGMPEQGDDAARRARAQAEFAQRQVADVLRMETVHVLARVDAVDQPAGVGNARQRQLHQDAVDLGIGIESVDQRQQLGFAGAGRQVVVERLDADLFRRAALVAHVDGGRRIAADQHHRQARPRLPGRQPRIDPQLELVEQFVGDAPPVEDAGRNGGDGRGIGHRGERV